MNYRDALVSEVIITARLPGAEAREQVSAELMSHLEDLAEQAERSGCRGDSVELFVRSNFGDPSEVGLSFARVYSLERFKLYAWVVLTVGSTLTTVATVLVYGAQRWLANLLDLPGTLSPRHFAFEVMLIGVAVSAYSVLSIGHRWALPGKSPLCIMGVVTVPLLGFIIWLRPEVGRVVILGLVFALIMCGAEALAPTWRKRIGANSLATAVAGFLLATVIMTEASRPMAFMIPMWLVLALVISAAAMGARALGSRIVARRFAV